MRSLALHSGSLLLLLRTKTTQTSKTTNSNNKRLATPQSVNSAIKAICDIMRRSTCAGSLQYVPELTWILFLRILDEREMREIEEAEAVGAEFTPSLQSPYRWQDWAAPPDSGFRILD
jgi:type I restriction enzyme M protein